MKKITFDEGYHEYMVNDDESRVIRIRLDPNMMKRFRKALDQAEEIEKRIAGKNTEDMLTAADAELRKIFNEAFCTDICTPAFGEASVLTPVSGGKALYQAFFEAFLPELRSDIEAATATAKVNAPRPEVQKYTAPQISKKGPIAGLAQPYGSEFPNIEGLTQEQKQQLIAQLIR